jgi:SAM-dependent methyltransferase
MAAGEGPGPVTPAGPVIPAVPSSPTPSSSAPPPPPTLAQRVALFGILSGAWLAQSCYALVKLGIPDLMAAGPRPVADLAQAAGAHPGALYRVLRAVGEAGLVRESAAGVFELTSLGQPLLSGVPRSSADAVVMFGEEVFRSFADITYTLRTGRPAFEKVYGKPFYDYLADSPDAARTFSAAMGDAPVPAALAACDLTGVRTVVDVGGGNGGLLARVLRAHPSARGVLVDLEPALRQAADRLARAGVADRAQIVTGSFFDPIPADGDVYVLSRVLHNWDDDDAVRVLRRVREAISPGGRLIVFEELLPAPAQDAPAGAPPAGPAADDGPPGPASPGRPAAGGHLIDLLILLMLSGCDRTGEQYRSLLAAAGFEITSVHPAPLRARQSESAIEAVPR